MLTTKGWLCHKINYGMNRLSYMSSLVSLLILVVCGCGRQGQGMPIDGDSTAIVQRLYDIAIQLKEEHNEDSTLVVMLKAADYSSGCKEHDICYKLYHALAQIYESKNLFDLQEKSLLRKLDAARAMDDAGKYASTLFELGISRYAQCDDEQALKYLEQASQKSPTDSARLRAKCQLMRCQVYLQTEENDSVEAALQQAKAYFPPIAKEETYHLSEVYMLNNTGREREAEEKARLYMKTDSIHAQIELLRVLLEIHKENGKYIEALDNAKLLMELSDSVSQMEASASTANIHRLQHEEQMKLAAANEQMLKERSRARTWSLLAILTLVASGAIIAIIVFRRKVVAARQAELDALRLAEDAQSSEAETRALNKDLQKRYYEHLYAILLPIINAKRKSNGHIDLNEKSWQLIEENTDLVLPRFTLQLRKNHPSLNDEDVRFCCLVAMRVPNPVIANIYGIASSSVAVRKQRMKRKLDESLVNETLETYLTHYGL